MIAEFIEEYLLPPERREDRLFQLMTNLCVVATMAALVAATLTLAYGHGRYAASIFICAFTLPLALVILRRSRSVYPAAHYLTANLTMQTLLLAAEPAVSCVVQIALAAGVALLDRFGARLWLAFFVAHCLFRALTLPTEMESAIAAVAALMCIMVFVIVRMSVDSRERLTKRAAITERRSSNQITMLQQLITENFDAYLVMTPEEIVSVSPSIGGLLGYKEADLTGVPWQDLIHPEEQHFLEAVGVGKGPARHELRVRHEDGRWIWVEAYTAPDLFFGNPHRTFVVLRNYNNQRKVSEQLMQAQRLESMGTVSAAVAHDFNNMLTVILGLADELPDSTTKFEITKVANNAAVLTNKLMTFGHGQVRSSEVHDLTDLMSELSMLIQHSLDAKYVFIEAYDDKPALVRIEEAQFEQVMVNLINNARESMPHGGNLELSLQTVEFAHEDDGARPGNFALIEVRDSGHGMDDVTKRRVFDPFFSTKPSNTNSGLGLSSCYGIVSQYGGFIEIESEPNSGTSVKVYLPIAETRDYEPEPPIRSIEASVLVVDDDPGVVRVIKNALTRANHRVADFTDPEDALHFFANNHVSLLISDVVMPNHSGADIAEKMRYTQPTLPVIFISGYTAAELDSWQQDDITQFLAKPFRGHEVVSKVEGLIAERRVYVESL